MSLGCKSWLLFCLALAPSVGSAQLAGFSEEQKHHAIDEREILTSTRLSEIDSQGSQHYLAQGAMRVNSSLKRTRAILTNYELYSKMIHYVSRSQWDPRENIVWLQGGIFRYRLSSWIHFLAQGTNHIRFRFVAGHFSGMQGDLNFEDLGEKGTWVTVSAQVSGKEFPPRFVIENGAKIVFGYTANRMRTFIERESQAYEEKTEKKEQEARDQKNEIEKIPRPRKTLAR